MLHADMLFTDLRFLMHDVLLIKNNHHVSTIITGGLGECFVKALSVQVLKLVLNHFGLI